MKVTRCFSGKIWRRSRGSFEREPGNWPSYFFGVKYMSSLILILPFMKYVIIYM